MTQASTANDKLAEAINAEHRSFGHVATGAGICIALIAVTAALSISGRQAPAPGAKPARHPLVKAIRPSLFSVTTWPRLRVWNAPASRGRTRALGFWGVLQASNLLFRRSPLEASQAGHGGLGDGGVDCRLRPMRPPTLILRRQRSPRRLALRACHPSSPRQADQARDLTGWCRMPRSAAF